MHQLFQAISFVFVIFALAACGIKGDPLPPLTAAHLGTGSPDPRVTTSPHSTTESTGANRPLDSIFDEDEEKTDE